MSTVKKDIKHGLKLPENGLIPIPAMTHHYGQIPCYFELEWNDKEDAYTKLFLYVPEKQGEEIKRVTYEIDCYFPRFHFNENYQVCITWCGEHKRPFYEFYFPVGTRFLDCSSLHSGVYCKIDFVMAKGADLSPDEKRVIEIMRNNKLKFSSDAK